MPVKQRYGKWKWRKLITLPDGTKKRIYGTATLNTKRCAEKEEREAINKWLSGAAQMDVVPTLEEFAKRFLEFYVKSNNRRSTYETKEMILRLHLVPMLGELKLNKIGNKQVEAYKADKRKQLSAKTVNDHLAVLHRLLVIGQEWQVIQVVPRIKPLKVQKTEADFLTFQEALNLVAAADEEWACMILIGIHTGLRLGELRALRWQDVYPKERRIVVRQAESRGEVGPPKSGRTREVNLSESAWKALTAQRHLRGPLVFCDMHGQMLTKGACKWPLWRACKRAGLGRRIGWHVLRHTFASLLVMKGVPIRTVQELLGHSTIEMTERYAHLSPNVKQDAVAKLDEAPPQESDKHPNQVDAVASET